MMNNFFKRADLLGVSVYEFVENYVILFNANYQLCGVASKEDVDKYLIAHDGYLDSMIIVDLSKFVNNLQVLTYDFLEALLEE